MTIDIRINQFAALVTAGIDAWVKAGQLLIELQEEDPASVYRITELHPWMTYDVLNGFARIGRKDIYPYLLLDQSPGARRLIELPYQEQCKYYDAEIVVVTSTGDTTKKRLQKLSKAEAEIVFCRTGVRSLEEQRKLLKPKRFRNVSPTGLPAVEDIEDDDPESRTVDQNLARAQACLLAVREILGDQNSTVYEKHITNGLNAIGGLRFEIKSAKLGEVRNTL